MNPYSNNDCTGNFVCFSKSPKYLFELIPTARQAYMTRHKNSVPLFNVKHDYFKNSFPSLTVIEWSKIDSSVRNSENLPFLKKCILVFIRPFANITFQCYNPKGLKLITWLRLGLSHLLFHKFKHSFQDTLNLINNCCTVETNVSYLLRCPNFLNGRLSFFKKLQSVDANVLSNSDSSISKVLLYCGYSYNGVKILLF